MNYEIFTDVTSDLPSSIIEEYNLKIIPFPYFINGKEFLAKGGDISSLKNFYSLMREKKHTFGTSMATGEANEEFFEETLKQGKDILYLSFSSGLSGSFASVSVTLERLAKKYPERKVFYIDTLAASMGEGLLVLNCARMRNEGFSIETVRDWAEAYKLKICHWFTVEDLDFLRRGGRVSAATAIVGSVLQIKPILHVDNAGHLISVGRTKGRKASIEKICSKIGELGADIEKQTVMISHGDCLEDAEYLADMIKQKYNPKEIIINYINSTIGSHSGPGTLAVFFIGTKR